MQETEPVAGRTLVVQPFRQIFPVTDHGETWLDGIQMWCNDGSMCGSVVMYISGWTERLGHMPGDDTRAPRDEAAIVEQNRRANRCGIAVYLPKETKTFPGRHHVTEYSVELLPD